MSAVNAGYNAGEGAVKKWFQLPMSAVNVTVSGEELKELIVSIAYVGCQPAVLI